MVKALIKNADLDWLEIHYPGVIYIASKNVLQGCLWFRMIYFPSEDKSVIDPDDSINFTNGIFIEDAYELNINLNNSHIVVREVAGRLFHTKTKWRFRSLSDIHVYPDGALCLCPEPEERLKFSNGFTLRGFFNDLLIPNLFYHSYLERYGKEPWRGSSHGFLGILESYNKQLFLDSPLDLVVNSYLETLPSRIVKLITSNKKVNLNIMCACDSEKRFRDCHAEAFNGLRKLQIDYSSLKKGTIN
jgi:hypothetical protein